MNTLKTFYKTVFTLSLFLMILSLNSQNITGKKVVVIDPGHGGIDSGAVGINGIQEKDIVLSIAKEMVRLNANTKSDFEIYLTRYKDTLISLSDRIRLTRNLKADLFISLHCNQAINRIAVGTEVYIHPKSEIQAKKCAYLGFIIQKGLADLLGIKNRGLKYGNFQVLRDSPYGSLSILLELGFLSQTDEGIYLSQKKSQEAIALVILQSTIKYLGL